MRTTMRLIKEMRALPVYHGVQRQKRLDAEKAFREWYGFSQKDMFVLLGIARALKQDCPSAKRGGHTFLPKGMKLTCADCGIVLDTDRFEVLSREPPRALGDPGPGSDPMTPGSPSNSQGDETCSTN